MNNENQTLNEQQAPEKNNDKAFVRVDTNGKPLMPDTQTTDTAKSDTPKEGTLADR